MKRIRVGVIGVGQVANVRHIAAYQRCPVAELVGVYDPNRKREARARASGVTAFYSDIDHFFSETNVEAVSVCTPPMTHGCMIRSALERNVHVLAEKPITTDSRDFRELGAMAEDRSLVFSTCHNFLFGKAMTKLKRLRQKQDWGPVLGATALQWSSWNRRLPDWHSELRGGLFFDEGPHLIYMIEHFLGDMEVTKASHSASTLSGKDGSHYSVEFTGGSGAICNMLMWFGAPQSEWLLAVGFENRTIVIDLFRDILVSLPPETKRDYKYILEIPARATGQVWASIGRWVVNRLGRGRHLYGHQSVINEFASAVVDGREPSVGYKDGFRVLRHIERALDYCEQRR